MTQPSSWQGRRLRGLLVAGCLIGATLCTLEAQPAPAPAGLLDPVPGGELERGLRATVERTGAVSLRWWLAAPGSLDVRIARREVSPQAGDWRTLATLRSDRFTDRTTQAGRVYEYEVVTEGLRVHGGGRSARVAVRVGEVLPPWAPALFEVVARGAEIEANWRFSPDARVGELELQARTGDGWTRVAQPAAHEVRATFAPPAGNPTRYRLVMREPDATGGEVSAETELTPALVVALSARPAPRLFITEEGAARLVALAETNAEVAQALAAAREEAEAALPVLRTGERRLPRQRSGAHQNHATRTRQLALGWLLFGEEEFRRAAVDTLLEYSEFYAGIPIVREFADGHLSSQTLNEAMTMVNFAWAFDLVQPGLTPAQRDRIRDGLMRPAAALISRHEGRGSSNWQTWHNAALVCIGIAANDAAILDRGLNGNVGMLWQLRNTLGRDGLYRAQSIAYHYFTMHGFTLAAAALEAQGVDVFSHRDGERSLRAMFDASFWHAFTNRHQAAFGNAQTNYTLDMQLVAYAYALAAARYRDPAFLWQWIESRGVQRRNDARFPVIMSLGRLLAADEADGTPLEPAARVLGTARENSAVHHVAGNTLLGDVGMAVLRGTPGAPTGEAAFIWKPHGKSAGHQHSNALAFHWQTNAHRWLPSAGKWTSSYTQSLHTEFTMQTLSDSTILVNRQSHRPVTPGVAYWVTDEAGRTSAGELDVFTAGPDFGYASAVARRAYDHAALARRLINAGTYTVDIAGAAAARSVTFDYVLHVLGEPAESNLTFSPAPRSLGRDHGFQHLGDLHAVNSHQTWQSVWSAPDADEHFYLTVLGASGTVFHRASTPWARNTRRSTLLVTRSGESADFLSVWRAGAPGADPVAGVDAPPGSGVRNGALRVRLTDGRHDLLTWAEFVREGTLGGVDYRARDVFLRFDAEGGLSAATVVQGERIVAPGLELRLGAPANWSWRALEQGAGLLVYDDDAPAALESVGTDLRVFALDALGAVDPDGEVVADSAGRRSLRPRTNYLLSPVGPEAVAIPTLFQTID